MSITQEQIDQAAREENDLFTKAPDVLQAQNQYLNNRVVVLRALVNAQRVELDAQKIDAVPETDSTDA